MSRYPDHLAPSSLPPNVNRSPKGRTRREPSGAFQLFQAPQIQQFKEAFSMIDQDGDGIVSEKDLRAMFANLGMTLSQSVLDELLTARPGSHFRTPSAMEYDDTVPERGVNFPMFLTMMGERLFEFDSEAELVEAFECFDENDNGYVKVDELRKWLNEFGDRMSDKEIDRFLKSSFTEHGNFKYREWAKAVRVNEDTAETES